MSLIRKHGAVLQAWACLALVIIRELSCGPLTLPLFDIADIDCMLDLLCTEYNRGFFFFFLVFFCVFD